MRCETGYAPFDALGEIVVSENYETDPTWDKAEVPDRFRRSGFRLIAAQVGDLPFVACVFAFRESEPVFSFWNYGRFFWTKQSSFAKVEAALKIKSKAIDNRCQ